MTITLIGLLGLLALFAFLLMGMPIGVSFLAVGFFGTAAIIGWRPAFGAMSIEIFRISSEYQLIVIPLFVLMGNFANVAGLGRDLYDAAHSWIGHFRGGLASTTIVAQAGFAALSGSSLASAVTMGRVRIARDEAFQLRRQAGHRCRCRRWDAWLLDPAQCRHGHLCLFDRAADR